MTDPITFTSASARFAMPFLFAAQAQKEFFVNEAIARLDFLLHPTVEGEANTPPATPENGESWLVGSAPTGEWVGHVDDIASYQSGNWLFAAPIIGMAVFDKTAGQSATFDGSWQRATIVSQPTGGATVDTEARSAINSLIAAFTSAGILP